MKRIDTASTVQVRVVSLRQITATHLDSMPKGTRSRFVDAAITEKLHRERGGSVKASKRGAMNLPRLSAKSQ